jgi:purine-nucleoside phosphorylase
MSEARPGPGDTFTEQALALIRERTKMKPRVALVLGSGLGDALSGDMRSEQEFSFESLPGFPAPSVPGHIGRLVMGDLYGGPAAVFRGRVHYYEGHGIGATTLIPRLVAALGAEVLILTNAAGGLDRSMRSGGLMLIKDHLNFLGVNPLAGWRFPDGQPAFVDLSNVYDRHLISRAEDVARREGVELRAGVYAALPGPTYETPAESAFLARGGAQAVGMSTVPEAVSAAALGLRVLAVSCITNVAGTEASHEDVLAAAKEASLDLRAILRGVVEDLMTDGRPDGL